MGEVRAETLGDRVERAIERHADTAGEIERGEQEKPRAACGATSSGSRSRGVSLYLVFPSIVDVFGSWRQITRFSVASLAGDGRPAGRRRCACLWALQHVALRARRWRPVIASQLAGNALSKIAPGGGAVGAALQYRMLVPRRAAGPRDGDRADRGQPARVRGRAGAAGAGDPGAAARRRRPQPARGRRGAGLASSRSTAGVGALSAVHRPAAGAGSAASSSASATGCAAAPSRCTGCRSGCCASATASSTTLGPRWKRALLGDGRALDVRLPDAAGRAGGDRLAPAPEPRPARVLRRAGAGADPGHAGRAGVRRGRADRDARARRRRPGDAVLATFAYRLFSYWLPLPFGLVGLALAPRPAS